MNEMTTTSELYNRQQDMDIYIPEQVTVIGLGGGGSWVAIALAVMGVKKLVICDNDFVEESNLNRTLLRYCDIGKLKTEAVEQLIKERRPDCMVTSFKNTSIKLYENYQAGLSLDFCSLLDAGLIIDATDNYQTRTLFGGLLGKGDLPRINYCKLGYDGTNFEIDWTFTPIEDSNLQGYRRVNTYVGTVLGEVATLIAQIGNLPTLLTNGHYSADINKHYKSIFTKDEFPDVDVALPLHYEGFKLIPFPEDMSFDLGTLIGKRCYVKNLEKTKERYNLDNIMKTYLYKTITISTVKCLIDKKHYQITAENFWWHSDDLLLITDEQYIAPEAEEVEEAEEETSMEYLIEDAN